jgi:adenine-specific DNA-methyltransferase
MRNDLPNFLLRLDAQQDVPQPIKRYLDSDDGRAARESYKCRNRTPWYAVPDVCVPDAFLSYMSGEAPAPVANHAGCVATNSMHARDRLSHQLQPAAVE